MKQSLHETKRMQLIAGLITESEYKQSLVKEDDNAKIVNQAAIQVASDDELEAAIDEIPTEKLAQLEKDLLLTIKKLQSQSNEPEIQTEAVDAEKVADKIETVAGGLAKSLLVPIIPVAVGAAMGSVAAGFGVTGLGIAALYGIAKAIKSKLKNKQ